MSHSSPTRVLQILTKFQMLSFGTSLYVILRKQNILCNFDHVIYIKESLSVVISTHGVIQSKTFYHSTVLLFYQLITLISFNIIRYTIQC